MTTKKVERWIGHVKGQSTDHFVIKITGKLNKFYCGLETTDIVNSYISNPRTKFCNSCLILRNREKESKIGIPKSKME